MNKISLAALAACVLALASCGASQPVIGLGDCNGHPCSPLTGGSATGALAATGANVPAAATGTVVSSGGTVATGSSAEVLSGTAAPIPALSAEAVATGAAVTPTAAPVQGIAVGEPNPSSPAPSGQVVDGYSQDPAMGWWLPVGTPAFKVQKLDAVLTPQGVTDRINQEGGWRYWHTFRALPGGVTYFFVVGPTEAKDEAGWYANFQVPAVDGSGAWLATVLLETTSAQPQAFAGLADMYKGVVKESGIPEGTARDVFKAAADGIMARKAQAPAN